MRSGELFAGVGGLGMAVDHVFGTRPAWFAEFDDAPSKVLTYRHPDVPNLGDVTNIDWPTTPRVQVLAGGFPCQDVSLAGRRRGMGEGTRSGLWSEYARAIDTIRPDWVVIENVRGLLSADANSYVEPCPLCVGDDPTHVLRALGAVLGDLADLGFDAEWTGIRASDIGAPHGRYRVFILAWPAERTAPHAGHGQRRTPRPEPAGSDDASLGSDRGGSRGGDDHTVTLLPTPRTTDMNGPGRHGDGGPDLRTVAVEDLEPVLSPSFAMGETDWGPYAAAIARWEAVTGRAAPAPVRYDGKGGKPRLNPALTEWMMGWPEGWVTSPEVGLSRAEQLKACGNGVVPQQAVAALRELLARPGVPAIREAVAA
ncbi:DNA cytosine methyltransferase [Nesterenkonia sp.]|uniref:DNA cytosine methyltransferase n=1 Tax=Nesterenkonia sp. TaxID=704201 RepID=UPI002636068B|nr:DNA cytosine methyltransferase [Nesterenkonia sp.]